MHDEVPKIGSIMRCAREAKGLTRPVLADQVDVSVRTIAAMEANERNLTYEVLYRLVHALDISADLIFYQDQVPLTTEQDQFIREYLACDEKEKRIVTTTLRSLMRALRHDEPEKHD